MRHNAFYIMIICAVLALSVALPARSATVTEGLVNVTTATKPENPTPAPLKPDQVPAQITSPHVIAANIKTEIPTAAIPNPSPRPVSPASAQAVADAPYLRTVLPKSAFAYLRIPSLWGFLGNPNGNIFSKAVQTSPHVDTILAIRNGILEHLIPEIPKEWRGLAEFLLVQIKSPLELAVLPSQQDQQGGLPELLLTASLNQSDTIAINKLLQSLVIQVPGFTLLTPIQTDGNGMLSVVGIPIQIYFDVAKRRLFVDVALFSSNAIPLKQRISDLKPVSDHPMYAVEKGIDSSGQGLMFWLDPAPLLQAGENVGHVREVMMLRAMGIAEIHSLALGIGGSGGKQHLKVMLDMPSVGLRNLLPALHTSLPFQAAGNLETVLMLGLPTPDDLSRFETALQPLLSAKDYQIYQHEKLSVQNLSGLTVEQLLGTFGGELLAIHDQAGYYLALGLRDQNNYQKLLQHLLQALGIKHETRELLGTTFHHILLPPIAEVAPPSAVKPAPTTKATVSTPGFIRHLVNHPTHIYWVERQGYMIIADIPQVLMDTMYITPKVGVDHWLRHDQGLDPAGALFLASTRSHGVPQLLYEIHLWLLNYLGDFSEQPIDLFRLPSAYELGLPDTGAYSIQLTTAPTQLALEAVYESNPMEGFLTLGGIQTLMAAGTAAAIAIPAYLDKDHNGQLTQQNVDAIVTMRNRLVEFRTVMGRFPSATELTTFLAERQALKGLTVTIAPDVGILTIKLPSRSQDQNPASTDELILTPHRDPTGVMRWECGGTTNLQSISSELCPQ